MKRRGVGIEVSNAVLTILWWYLHLIRRSGSSKTVANGRRPVWVTAFHQSLRDRPTALGSESRSPPPIWVPGDTDVDSEEMELLGRRERDFGRSSGEFPSTDEVSVWDPRGTRNCY